MTETNPIRILLADDHQLVIDGIKSMLAADDRLVVRTEVNDGQAALDAIKGNPGQYDLLITDISMPRMNGIDVCRSVKQEESSMKVLMLSMYHDPFMIKESIEAEADGYIVKNSGKDEFLEAITRIMNDGTYYSQEIVPVILRIVKNERSVAQDGLLSARELEVLKLIVKELTSGEIAERLFISKKTVDNHRASLLVKTGSKSTIGLVKYAIYNGLT